MCNEIITLLYKLFFTGKRRSVEMQHKLEATELHNEMQRNREEKVLLVNEMKAVLHYYQDCVISTISREISGQ